MTAMRLRSQAIGALRFAAGIVPDSATARLLPSRLRWNPDSMQVLTATPAPVGLLIAPANSAGQGRRWAQAATSFLPGVAAANLMTTNPRSELFAFPADVAVPENGYLFAHGWQRRQRRAILDGFSHVLVESGRYLYGPVPWRSPAGVLHDLTRRGVKVALLWHGSDIRLPSAHASWEQDSPFGPRGHYPARSTAVLERNASDRRRMIDESDFISFVSTPGLLDVPRSRWLPVVVEPERWRSDAKPLTGRLPVVAYVPSNSAMKGDDSVDEQLMSIEREGLIRYRRLTDIPSNEMPGVYRSADIVLDQFRLGDYGVAACEAMAAGRVVIGHVHDDVRSAVKRISGRDLPIVESRFADVGAVIRGILADPAPAQRAAREGAGFVADVHSGRFSAAQLSEFLGTPAPPARRGEE